MPLTTWPLRAQSFLILAIAGSALAAPVDEQVDTIERDWRLQDGIGTQRRPATWSEAIERTLRTGDGLILEIGRLGEGRGDGLDAERAAWEALRDECRRAAAGGLDDARLEDLWRRVHHLRRRIALRSPDFPGKPIVFVKQVPGTFSHQLTQYYGRYARPGGGIFVLDRPGESLASRRVAADSLPPGSYQHLDVSWDGTRAIFSFCAADADPVDPVQGHRGRYYNLYEAALDGLTFRRLTDGPFDDFAPRYLPDDRIVFVSTRRLGWHRCGNPGCENYTLAVANADGSDPRPLSFHETQEWDPAVLEDGRVAYTRWDYVDRHAVFYEQLWTTRPDGTGAAALFGNNTFNPVGIWEPRQVPGTRLIMATAAAHHAMTAGSIVLVDAAKGVDGELPIERLTPDVPFPESESLLLPGWRASVDVADRPTPPEAERWPGHSYRSPFPLSAKLFLAAYGFEPLVGEPKGNAPGLFGVYLVDAFGGKELLHRDPDISSVWPMPARRRARPPVLAQPSRPDASGEGLVFLQDVYESAPGIERRSIRALRVIQVLPKSTPGANSPPVGLANASPGKQVLGTVPVEPDGSALFRVPSGRPLSFQALDELGRAVQTMRSVVYLQRGETASCIGCHEHRTLAPPQRRRAMALARPPSVLTPGPDGSRPLSYPILVQPVLDRHCASCHSGKEPKGGLSLVGDPQGHYTVSYLALAPRVPFSQWTGNADFRETNSEPVSIPGRFGARASRMLDLLLDGHGGVRLEPDEFERLVTWMDANALFYGTFDPAGQARQQRGERIDGPALE